jgi:3-oxoacyl-[acyl-carrier-protein] synthase II
MRPDATIVGSGVVAPGGATVDELWAALVAGASVAEPYADGRTYGFDAVVARAPDVDNVRLDRCHGLALAAATQALAGYAGEVPDRARCAVVCGVGLTAARTLEDGCAVVDRSRGHGLSPLLVPTTMPSSVAGLLSIRFGFTGPSLAVSTACASGATAIGEAVELLRAERADLVVAGGVDALLSAVPLCGFARLGVLSANVAEPALASRPFDIDRDGLVIGEGAGFVVLVRAADAPPAEAGVSVDVVGYATTSDARHLVAPDPSGDGALAAMSGALRNAGIDAGDVGHVNAHGTSTVAGDRAEAVALRRLFPHGTPPVTAVKGTTGHCVAGSGAIEVAVTARSLLTGLVPPVAGLREIDPKLDIDAVLAVPRRVSSPIALSTSYGFGGANVALVLATR